MFERSVFVTGCDSGIGFELAKRLPKLGLFAICTCTSAAGRDRINGYFATVERDSNEVPSNNANEVDGTGAAFVENFTPVGFALVLDVTDRAKVREASLHVSALIKSRKVPKLYAVVNNAGIWRFSRIQESSLCVEAIDAELDSWEQVIRTNLFGYVYVTLYFLPLLSDSTSSNLPPTNPSLSVSSRDTNTTATISTNKNSSRRAKRVKNRIILISSVLDSIGLPGQPSYVTSKFGVRGLHESLLHELDDVVPILISPGALRDTSLFDRSLEAETDYRFNYTQRLKRTLGMLKRLGSNKEGVVCTIVRALTTDKPRYRYSNTSGTLMFKLCRLIPRPVFVKLFKAITRYEFNHKPINALIKSIAQ